jgi:hypothetical protein
MELFKNPISTPRYIGFQNTAEKDSFFDHNQPDRYIALTEQTHKENSRKIETPGNVRWIRIAENHAEGWEYRTNGESQSKWRAALRAGDSSMLLHPGESSSPSPKIVEMRYNPPLRRLGFTISAVSLGLLTFGQWLTLRPRRRKI